MNIFDTNSAWVATATELKLTQQKRKELETEEARLMSAIKELSGFKPSKGGQFIFDYFLRKGAVEYKNIPELKNVDLDVYRKEDVQVWKLDLVLEVKS